MAQMPRQTPEALRFWQTLVLTSPGFLKGLEGNIPRRTDHSTTKRELSKFRVVGLWLQMAKPPEKPQQSKKNGKAKNVANSVTNKHPTTLGSYPAPSSVLNATGSFLPPGTGNPKVKTLSPQSNNQTPQVLSLTSFSTSHVIIFCFFSKEIRTKTAFWSLWWFLSFSVLLQKNLSNLAN